MDAGLNVERVTPKGAGYAERSAKKSWSDASEDVAVAVRTPSA